MKRNILLYHIIYTLFFSFSFSQNIHLKLKGIDSYSEAFLNKIEIKKKFEDLKSLQNEIDRIKTEIHNQGYFNANLLPKNKTNDSTYLLKIKLNFKYEKITINYNANQISHLELKNILDEKTEINKRNFVTNTNELEKNLNNIIQHLSNKGKVFSKLQLNNISISTNNVSANLFLDITETNYISDIKIKGY